MVPSGAVATAAALGAAELIGLEVGAEIGVLGGPVGVAMGTAIGGVFGLGAGVLTAVFGHHDPPPPSHSQVADAAQHAWSLANPLSEADYASLTSSRGAEYIPQLARSLLRTRLATAVASGRSEDDAGLEFTYLQAQTDIIRERNISLLHEYYDNRMHMSDLALLNLQEYAVQERRAGHDIGWGVAPWE